MQHGSDSLDGVHRVNQRSEALPDTNAEVREVETDGIRPLQQVPRHIVEGVQRLPTASRMHMQRVRTRPPPDPRDQIPLPEVHDADLAIGLLAREPRQLELDLGAVLGQVDFLRAVRVVVAVLDQVSVEQVDDGVVGADEVGDRVEDPQVAVDP